MKLNGLHAIAIAIAIATPIAASAAPTGGTVCGRVNADPSVLVSFLADPLQFGTVIARSATETVTTKIGNGGTYCFKNLHPDLHTIVAFGEAAQYSAVVTPLDGQTLRLDLNAQS